MERATPVRNPHASTADLLTWSDDSPPAASPATVAIVAAGRFHHPSDKITNVMFGGKDIDAEADGLSQRKPCSGYKLKEMTGSGIFVDNGKGGQSESGLSNHSPNNRTSVRVYEQALKGVSQISFSTEESLSPRKPTSLPEVAKQRELSGTLENESETNNKKQISGAKCKELSGHNIFGPPEVTPRSQAAARVLELKESKDFEEPAPRNVRTSVKVSSPAGGQSNGNILSGEDSVTKSTKKIHNQKFAELTGNGIFKGDDRPAAGERPLSTAKLREMSGSNIFADGKAAAREGLGGVRRPPGGKSSIALV